jgi:proline dehydrogenase
VGIVDTVLRDNPVVRAVSSRVTRGDYVHAGVDAAVALTDSGRWVSFERVDTEEPDVVLADAVGLARALYDAGLSGVSEIDVFPFDLGEERLMVLARTCAETRVDLMLGFGDGADIDVTWDLAERLRATGASVGVTVSAAMRRTEADCRTWADSRIRLVKGAHQPAGGPIFRSTHEVDKSYVRCARALIAGSGMASFATHDQRLVEIVEALADKRLRAPGSYEFAFYAGRRDNEQQRLLAGGHRVRVSIPLGPDLLARVVGNLVQQPSTLASGVLALVPRRSVAG